MIYQIYAQNSLGYFNIFEIEGTLFIDEKTGQCIIKNDTLEILAIAPNNMLVTQKRNIE